MMVIRLSIGVTASITASAMGPDLLPSPGAVGRGLVDGPEHGPLFDLAHDPVPHVVSGASPRPLSTGQERASEAEKHLRRTAQKSGLGQAAQVMQGARSQTEQFTATDKADWAEHHKYDNAHATTTPTGVCEFLWSGYDFANNTFSFKNLARRLPGPDPEAEAKVQVFGLPNSGTDLLNALLYINFGYRLEHYAQPFNQPSHKPGVWRFSNLKMTHQATPLQFKELFSDAQANGANVKAIIMLRNPISWLEAMRVNPPRELRSCGQNRDNSSAWVSKECTHPMPGGPDSQVPSTTFHNLPGMWNQWSDGYFNSTLFGVPNRKFVHYESLVHEPHFVIEQVAKFLGIKAPAFQLLPDDNSGSGQAYASVQVHNKKYMERLTDSEVNKACQFLNPKLMEEWRYHRVCPEFPHKDTERVDV